MSQDTVNLYITGESSLLETLPEPFWTLQNAH